MRGSEIKQTPHHGAGAYGRCSYCNRYSDDPNCIYGPHFMCNCGKSHGYSGSFLPPTESSIWHNNDPLQSEPSGIAAIGLPEYGESSYQETHSGIPEPLIEGARWINPHTEFLVPESREKQTLKDLLRTAWDLGGDNHDNPHGGFENWYEREVKTKYAVSPPPQAESCDTIADEIEASMERERLAGEEHHPTGYYLGLEAALKIVSERITRKP